MVWLVVIIRVVMVIRIRVSVRLQGFLIPDSQTLEQVWTLIPVFILVGIAFPRVRLLCLQDALGQGITRRAKLVRNQWNWQREWDESYDHLLDSEGIDRARAYEVPFLLAAGKVTRLLVTRTDVLHSIGVPSLGVKLDSVPGRLNATALEVNYRGLFVGSCYELCGRGHRVIPIKVLVV